MRLFIFALCMFLSQLTAAVLPSDHLQLKKPISYVELVEFLKEIGSKPHINVREAGKSVHNRSLFLVHMQHGSAEPQWKVFFYAQQHGDEPAGKDALLYLIHYIAEKPGLLPQGVGLWIMPMVNPDGAEKGTRRNANDADLNRDHQVLLQPETRVLHKVFRSINPHVTADCHEFTRDSRSYTERGWLEWPQIMMDFANNPLFSPNVTSAAWRWCRRADSLLNGRNINYTRYFVGGTPPDDELRFSSPEVDDGRNGLGAYGGLSFIIESGVKRGNENSVSDLGERVDAYLNLLQFFLQDQTFLKQDLTAIRESKQGVCPPFIPVNYFWGNTRPTVTPVKVIDLKTVAVKEISTANFMHDLVIKKSVSTPNGYAIAAPVAYEFEQLLLRHALPYEIVSTSRTLRVQSSRLVSMEDKWDAVYSRYAGRQIVERDSTYLASLPAGSLLVRTDNPDWRRIVLLLEPAMMFGIYNFSLFQNLVSEDDILPVLRLIDEE